MLLNTKPAQDRNIFEICCYARYTGLWNGGCLLNNSYFTWLNLSHNINNNRCCTYISGWHCLLDSFIQSILCALNDPSGETQCYPFETEGYTKVRVGRECVGEGIIYGVYSVCGVWLDILTDLKWHKLLPCLIWDVSMWMHFLYHDAKTRQMSWKIFRKLSWKSIILLSPSADLHHSLGLEGM